MKKTMYIFALTAALSSSCSKSPEKLPAETFRTVCNPVNISYRFQPEAIAGRVNGKIPSYREGADPTAVMFRDEYYAFVSHSGGYFHSTDLVNWRLIVPNKVFPLEQYAPTAFVMNGELYLVTSGVGKVFRTSDPKSGEWTVAKEDFKLSHTDPAVFVDDDGRLYYYAGCSNRTPIWGCELDPATFEPLTELAPVIQSDYAVRGWEVKNDYNIPDDDPVPWIEGAWMNKHGGRYYLQYASPGTELKSYSDAVFESAGPLGPFTLARHNPFAYKPEGFACGAGHGSTFADRYGNFWHIGTVTVSQRHSFERRLALFPLFFDGDGCMAAYTGFGDWPMIMPDRRIESPAELFPGWMLLSYGRKVEVSSTLPGFEAANAVDEDIRTWWSAATGNGDEWIAIDLGETDDVYAVQVNFADEGAQIYGRKEGICYQYTVEASVDGRRWETVADRSTETADMPHDYIQLLQPVRARHFRIKNIYYPSGNFSVSGLRIFGRSSSPLPPEVEGFTAERDADRRVVHLKWEAAEGAVGYNIRYGTDADKLYGNYTVYGKNELTIRSLNAAETYVFAIDAFNGAGVRESPHGVTQ
ncbi:MAG: family 43 glycosylhydrolase [Tannerella sp.]|jgi:hypothetical protein|nr:family 43 glycosylhydrolase [Tannerella sp.]